MEAKSLTVVEKVKQTVRNAVGGEEVVCLKALAGRIDGKLVSRVSVADLNAIETATIEQYEVRDEERSVLSCQRGCGAFCELDVVAGGVQLHVQNVVPSNRAFGECAPTRPVRA